MRRFFVWSIGIVAGIGVLLVGLYCIASIDVVELEYATHADALAAGSIENETIPDFLPRSATAIHSVRNLDLNNEVVTFSFGPDFDEYLARQVKAPPRSAEDLRIRGAGAEFDEAHRLIYIPKVMKDGQFYPGSLLVNPGEKRALYFE